MRAENPIAAEELADAEVLAASATSLAKAGVLVGRFRRTICGPLFLGVAEKYRRASPRVGLALRLIPILDYQVIIQG